MHFILLFVFFTSFNVFSHNDFSCKDSIVFGDAVKSLKKTSVMEEYLIEEYFSSYSKECQSYSDYVIGLLYLLYLENLKSIDKAVKYLERSSNSNNYDAMGTLGTIYFSEDRYFDTKKGAVLLEDASVGGNTEAMRNLYVFSKKGLYDQEKGYRWLVSSMNLGNENSAIYFAQELQDRALSSKDFSYTKKAIEHLKKYKFDKYESERDYYLVQIFLDKRTPYYNVDEGFNYLEKAAALGHKRAISDLEKYKAWLEKNN